MGEDHLFHEIWMVHFKKINVYVGEKETGTDDFIPESLCSINFSAYLTSFYFVLSLFQMIIRISAIRRIKLHAPKFLRM